MQLLATELGPIADQPGNSRLWLRIAIATPLAFVLGALAGLLPIANPDLRIGISIGVAVVVASLAFSLIRFHR